MVVDVWPDNKASSTCVYNQFIYLQLSPQHSFNVSFPVLKWKAFQCLVNTLLIRNNVLFKSQMHDLNMLLMMFWQTP